MLWPRCLALVLLLALSISTGAANDKHNAIILGVYPYLSANQIIKFFSPLQNYLSQKLGREVILRSAPNFKEFVYRTSQGEYDIAFTAPHMGRRAQLRDGYQVLAQTGYRIVIVTLVPKDSPVRTLADLRGRSLVVGARLSMTHLIMHDALAETGLRLGKDVVLKDAASFSNVFKAVLDGDADAGATGSLLWDSLGVEERSHLREIYRSRSEPGFLLIGHPRLGQATLRQLSEILYDFSTTPAGKAFFANTQMLDFRPIDQPSLRSLDRFVKAFDEH